jgi:hypothetical protein
MGKTTVVGLDVVGAASKRSLPILHHPIVAVLPTPMKSALLFTLCALAVVAADVTPPSAAAADLGSTKSQPTEEGYEWCRRVCYWRYHRRYCYWRCWH